jgi:hypothetical protein
MKQNPFFIRCANGPVLSGTLCNIEISVREIWHSNVSVKWLVLLLSYWKVQIQNLEDVLHRKHSSGSGYDLVVGCCERGDEPSLYVKSLFYLTSVICRVGGPLSGYGLYDKRSVRKVTTILFR